MMDIPRAVEQIYEDADFRRADTYQNLVETWRDKRPVPTEQELATAWVQVLEQDVMEAMKNQANQDLLTLLHNELIVAGMSCEEKVNMCINLLRAAFPEI